MPVVPVRVGLLGVTIGRGGPWPTSCIARGRRTGEGPSGARGHLLMCSWARERWHRGGGWRRWHRTRTFAEERAPYLNWRRTIPPPVSGRPSQGRARRPPRRARRARAAPRRRRLKARDRREARRRQPSGRARRSWTKHAVRGRRSRACARCRAPTHGVQLPSARFPRHVPRPRRHVPFPQVPSNPPRSSVRVQRKRPALPLASTHSPTSWSPHVVAVSVPPS